MYYRRKFILALLQLFGGQLDNLNLQKLLFLATRKQEKKSYDFVPYKYGCFSFQANQDLMTMVKRGNLIKEGNTWNIVDKEDYNALLKKEDKSSYG